MKIDTHTFNEILPQHRLDKNLQCFVKKNSFQGHLTIHVGASPCVKMSILPAGFSVDTYVCPILECDKTFDLKDQLTAHMTVHSNNNCTVCGKTFKQKYDLARHGKVHSNERPYSCEVCLKSFKRRPDLVQHMKTHSERHKCLECGKGFKCKGALSRHLRVHTGECTYTCSVCEQSFNRRNNLKTHMKIHLKETPLKCQKCEKNFALKCHLKEHLRLHAYEGFICPICHKTFSTRNTLSHHVRTHKHQLEFNLNDSQSNQESVVSAKSEMSTTVDQGTEFKAYTEPISAVDEKNMCDFHNSESPYIINVKIEEDV